MLANLLNSFISNKLNRIDLSLVNDEIKNQLATIRLLLEKLGEKQSDDAILMEAIQCTNYALLVSPDSSNIGKSLEVAQMMSMLERSESYKEKITGKTGILFTGPTGAGKSLTVGRILGYEVDECEN